MRNRFNSFQSKFLALIIGVLGLWIIYKVSPTNLIFAFFLYSLSLAFLYLINRFLFKKALTMDLFFGIFLILIIIEIGLRVAFSKIQTYNERIGLSRYISMYETNQQGWYCVNEANKVIERKQNEFYFSRETNSLGLTAPDPQDINHSKKKILCLGDSFTEGVGASLDSTWPNLLQLRLDAAYPDSFVVVNAGVSGSDLYFSWKLFKDKLQAYQADEIIIFTGNSDIIDVVIRGGDERFKSDTTVQYRKAPAIEPLFVSSFICRYIMLEFLNYEFSLMPHTTFVQKQNEACYMLKAKIIQIIDDSSIPIHVILFPVPGELKKKSYYADQTLEIKNNPKINGHDLLQKMIAKHANLHLKTDEISWPQDGHYNGKGYDLISQLIFETLYLPINDTE